MLRFLLLTTVFLGAIAASAQAGTFDVEASGHSVKTYGTSNKHEHCTVIVTFSYSFADKRVTTSQTCQAFMEPGKHKEVCSVTDPQIVDPKVEGPPKVEQCVDLK